MALQGWAGSNASLVKGAESGVAYSRFRLVVPRGRRKDSGEWEELESRWYTVKAWGPLAENLRRSISSGDAVIVVGQPRAQAWIDKEGQVRSEIAVHATAVGHDLVRGQSIFYKTVRDSDIPDRETGELPSSDPHMDELDRVDQETGEIIGEDSEEELVGTPQQ